MFPAQKERTGLEHANARRLVRAAQSDTDRMTQFELYHAASCNL
jgi:hypothetical protein